MMVTLAKVKAGHDKNHIYVVAGEENGRVLLVNGATKPISKPKPKNWMHIQPIKKLPKEIQAFCEDKKEITDELVVKILELYKTHLSSQMSN